MSLKKNVAANFLGQGWTALMGIIFVPTYIKYMGIESYGLIGVFALLQAWITLFDLGMTPALSREMARFTGGAHDAISIRNLLRTVECIGVFLALLVAFGVWFASDWLAINWLKTERLSPEVVASAFSLMGLVAALRAIENIYRSSLIGLQRQVVVNAISSVTATMRGAGAVAVLALISPTIISFFVWQVIMSVITVVWLLWAVYKDFPTSIAPAKFSQKALRELWQFASGILVITLLSFLLMQTDKILLSRLLSLENFGYYALAALVANALFMLAGPIDIAFFPRLTKQAASLDQSAYASTFHLGSQLISVFVGSASIMVIVFSEFVLNLWTQNSDLAQRLAPILSILSLGTLLNCIMHMPYQLQLSHGWTSLTIKVNMVAVVLLVPAIFWLAPRYGPVGVAWGWVALNATYVFVVIHLVFNRLLIGHKWRWYFQDVLIPLCAAAAVAVALKLAMPPGASRLMQLLAISVFSSLTLLTAAFASSMVRKEIISSAKGLLGKFNL